MRIVPRVFASAALLIAAACSDFAYGASPPPPATTATATLADMPLWAYGVESPPKPGDKAEPQAPPQRAFDPAIDHDEQLKPQHVAGSKRSYTLLDLSDQQNAVDWFPDEHAPMPDVVQHGPARMGKLKRACAACHGPNGRGRPENAPIAGLPVAYFLGQLEDFRNGRRKSSDPRKPNVPTMIALAKAMTDAEMRAAATYYAAQSGGPPVYVIETTGAPKAELHGNLYIGVGDKRSESLANRILEMPSDPSQSQTLDNPHYGHVAYVEKGSVERGRQLVTTGNAAGAQGPAPTLACITCHGVDLRGVGEVPPLAGRSPSYVVRQLYDFRTGARNGSQAVQMKPAVAHLTTAQMTDIAAYLATLPRADADHR